MLALKAGCIRSALSSDPKRNVRWAPCPCHRLCAGGGQVENRQSPVTESDARLAIDPIAVGVRSAANQRVIHAAQQRGGAGFTLRPLTAPKPREAAHANYLRRRRRKWWKPE